MMEKRTLHIRGRQDKTRRELERPCGCGIVGGTIPINAESVERRRCRGRYVYGGAVHRGQRRRWSWEF